MGVSAYLVGLCSRIASVNYDGWHNACILVLSYGKMHEQLVLFADIVGVVLWDFFIFFSVGCLCFRFLQGLLFTTCNLLV